jgi:regulator of protease activity HflC (stomatin/prohibitin superfamily)
MEGDGMTGIEQATAVFEPRAPSRQQAAHAVAGARAAASIGLGLVVGGAVVAASVAANSSALTVAGFVLLAVPVGALFGFIVVQPNESSVLILFGRYIGTITESGWWWVNPLTVFWRETISLRVRNFQSDRLKVNDAGGSPIDIAAVVVWRVVDTAKAVFDVEEFREFVVVQSETAVRHLAAQFPYDDFSEADSVTLRSGGDEVLSALHRELQERLAVAGIEILETRLTHLAYASEIAEVMLRRQQASAIVAARRTIVTGAVGLVEMALREIGEQGIVELDEERKAAMASNLLVVLAGDRGPTPVLNTGSLYT